MAYISIASIALAAAAALWYYITLHQKSSRKPLPPGPSRLPLIGNLHQAPTEWPWRVYAAWAQTYGPIFSVQYGRDTIIFLSTHQTARDLLDKRSNIYSSRPHLVMGNDCVSKGNRSVLMPMGPKYRNHQRIQGSFLTAKKSAQYTPLQDLESLQLISELLTAGQDEWMGRFHRYSSSLIYALAYGKRMPRGDETEIREVGQVMENFLYAARPGTWIVDAIPTLNRLPTFLAPWKRIADQFHAMESRVATSNVSGALKVDGWNWSKEAMTLKEARGMPAKELAYAVNSLYEAGSDTTTQALQSFVLAAMVYPQEYRKAQVELDRILGDTFPAFEHRSQLAYVEAVAREVLRWRSVSAGGIPHAVTQDDVYMGYLIPSGATVIGNHWAIDRDTKVYGNDIDDFRPSRWIENPDLPLAAFGYGRRVCSGQHVAMNSLFIIIARLLWTFDISYGIDSKGDRIEVDSLAYTQGLNCGPLPFAARFVPRSEEKKRAVEQMWAAKDKNLRALLDTIQQQIGRSS